MVERESAGARSAPRHLSERSCHDVDRTRRAYCTGILGRSTGGAAAPGPGPTPTSPATSRIRDGRPRSAPRRRGTPRAGRLRRGVDVIAGSSSGAARRPSPVARYVLVHDGELVLSEVLPGQLHGPESIGVGAVPDLSPLVAHRPFDLPFLVVHAGKEGGRFRALPTRARPGRRRPRGRTAVQGRTDTLHYAKAGTGWKQPHWQAAHRGDLEAELAATSRPAVDETVRTIRPGLVVVAGDVTRPRAARDGSRRRPGRSCRVSPGDPRADDASEAGARASTSRPRTRPGRRHPPPRPGGPAPHPRGRGDNQSRHRPRARRRGAPAGPGRDGRARRRGLGDRTLLRARRGAVGRDRTGAGRRRRGHRRGARGVRAGAGRSC